MSRLLLTLAVVGQGMVEEDRFVGPADLQAYQDALGRPGGGSADPVTFLDLWRHPDAFQGRQVRVEGRVERRFRQPPVGDFPALTELWIVDEGGNPLCLVFPASEAGEPGQDVRFEGTFLRRIRYRGADAERLAPLIVGPEAPRVSVEAEPEGGAAATDLSWLEGWIAALLAVAVVAILGLQHLRRRSPARRIYDGPDPEFRRPDDEEADGSPTDVGDAHP